MAGHMCVWRLYTGVVNASRVFAELVKNVVTNC